MKKILIFILCLFLFFGCAGSSSDDSDSTSDTTSSGDGGSGDGDSGDATGDTSTFVGNNNSATLTGTTIGSAETENANLKKDITVTVTNSNGFSVSKIVASRSSESSDYLYWMFTITNDNSIAYCFVQASNVAFKNSSETTIQTSSTESVKGSTGTQSGVTTSTCLAPGESGIVAGLEEDIFTNTASIVVESIEGYSTPEISDPSGKVIPQSYTYSEEAFSDRIDITIKNTGSSAVSVDFVYYYLISSGGDYLHWGLTSSSNSQTLSTDESTTAFDDTFSYSGSASSVLVIVDFEDSTSSSSVLNLNLPENLTFDQRNKALNDARKRKIMQKYETYLRPTK